MAELPQTLTAEAWAQDRKLLHRYQAQLMEVVGVAPVQLLTTTRSDPWTYGDDILGVVLHDAYHAGQIRLIVAAEAASKGKR